MAKKISYEAKIKSRSLNDFLTPIKCPHCKGEIAIRNPSGYCDHQYYPENCETCKEREEKNDEKKVV